MTVASGSDGSRMAGAEQWNIQIHWQTPDEFAGDEICLRAARA